MDKARILYSKNKALMNEFSGRCIHRLENLLIFKLSLPFFRSLLDANVQKEIEKDRLIIEEAASAFQRGDRVENVDLEAIFEKTKDIDKNFIKKVSLLPLSIHIKYDTIENIRKERLKCIVRVIFDLLNRWEDSIPFADIVKKTYTEANFKEIIKEILHLYILETRMISNTMQFFPPINMIKEVFTENILSIMEQEKEALANDLAKKLFRGNPPCPDLT